MAYVVIQLAVTDKLVFEQTLSQPHAPLTIGGRKVVQVFECNDNPDEVIVICYEDEVDQEYAELSDSNIENDFQHRGVGEHKLLFRDA